jgi:rubrerythrin
VKTPSFKLIASVEKHHEERYNKLVANIEKVFKNIEKTPWRC